MRKGDERRGEEMRGEERRGEEEAGLVPIKESREVCMEELATTCPSMFMMNFKPHRKV